MKYHRILVKFSGEFFSQAKEVLKIIEEIRKLLKLGVKVAVVCGGGNISRWKDVRRGNHLQVDFRGMKGTLTNAVLLEKKLKKEKLPVQLYTSFSINSAYPKFNSKRAVKDLNQAKVVILAGGTGYPFFTTDTAAVLWSLILQAEVYIKATKVDGVYSADPLKNSKAKRFSSIKARDYLLANLAVVDQTAVCLAKENQLPIQVLKWQAGKIVDFVKGQPVGSTIKTK